MSCPVLSCSVSCQLKLLFLGFLLSPPVQLILSPLLSQPRFHFPAERKVPTYCRTGTAQSSLVWVFVLIPDYLSSRLAPVAFALPGLKLQPTSSEPCLIGLHCWHLTLDLNNFYSVLYITFLSFRDPLNTKLFFIRSNRLQFYSPFESRTPSIKQSISRNQTGERPIESTRIARASLSSSPSVFVFSELNWAFVASEATVALATSESLESNVSDFHVLVIKVRTLFIHWSSEYSHSVEDDSCFFARFE